LENKAVSGIMLTLLLTSMLTLAFNVQPAKAWTGTVYIRADGSIDPPDAPIITFDNITYTLTDNITSTALGIVLERNNIVIDGAGYTVQGTGSGTGVRLEGIRNVTIKNTNIKYFYYGIRLSLNLAYYSPCRYNNISGNNITNNEVGIWLSDTRNSNISGNNITNNQYGIRLSYIWYPSRVNIISRNNITNNGYGVYDYGGSDNRFYHNNFIDNTQQIRSSGYANVWDDGYPSGGNYWSDYTDVDLYSGLYQNETGSDGIWDHPYVIDYYNQDRYPLVNPWTPTPLPNFSITASPTSLTIQQGSSDTSVITITSINGFNQPVQLTVYRAPSGVTTTLNPEQVTPPPDGSTTSTLTVSVSTTATPGSYTLTVVGTNGTITHSVDITLEITAPLNQPPDPPTFLFQYELDGPEIPVGGTISGDAVSLIGGVSDPDGDRVKLQVELRRLDEYDGSFIGVPTHESEFVDSGYGVIINVSGLILGSYHWQARTMDTAGATSEWVSFPEPVYPPNPESAADFTIGLIFNPPYEFGASGGLESSFLAGEASYDSTVQTSVGEGITRVNAWVPAAGSAEALAWFTLEELWGSDLSGTANIAATFNITGYIETVIATFEPFLPAQTFLGITLKANFWVYDHTTGQEVFRKERIIFEDNIDWQDIIPIPPSETKQVSYKDTQFILQELLALQKGHTYSWHFETRIYTMVVVAGVAFAGARGSMTTELIDVRIDAPVLRPEPEPILAVENVMYVAVGSPVDILVIDPEGRRIGFDFASMQEVNEIPEAWYSGYGTHPQFIRIQNPIEGNYEVLLSGTDTDTYSLTTLTRLKNETVRFMAIDIPTSANAVHQYTINWTALSRGEEGVTVKVDSQGDGVFELTFTAGNELTQGEFVFPKTAIFRYNAVWEGVNYPVVVSSGNSTLVSFIFNQLLMQISFEVSGETGMVGYCNVTIPKTLLKGEPWAVKINGVDWSFTSSDNATHSFIYFTYTHASTLQVVIQGTWVIPEFPSAILLSLFMILSMLAVVLAKKRSARKPKT